MPHQTFTLVRSTELDQASLLVTLRVADPTTGFARIDLSTYIVKKSTVWTGPQINFVQNALENAPILTPQSAAQTAVDNMSIYDKALALALIDQINVIRANLSPPLNAITPAQAINSIRNKAGTL